MKLKRLQEYAGVYLQQTKMVREYWDRPFSSSGLAMTEDDGDDTRSLFLP